MRRRADITRERVLLWLIALNMGLSLFASVLGYQALSAMSAFSRMMDTISEIGQRPRLPGAF